MGGFLSFVKKETLHIVRDPRTMLIALLMPIVQILLFGFAISTEVNNVNVAVVASRPSETIRQAVTRIEANPYFTLRGFIPASRLSDEYVEDLNEFARKTLEVTVITADEENHRLVLSARETAREKKQAEKNQRIAKCEVGAVMKGTVETIKPYGAFIALENGLSGLVHISQISTKRIKHPGAVLKEGQEVTVKILSTADNKISLSMKALEEEPVQEEETFDYQEKGEASTALGSLLKGFKFD